MVESFEANTLLVLLIQFNQKEAVQMRSETHIA